jgi:hypothetical protein
LRNIQSFEGEKIQFANVQRHLADERGYAQDRDDAIEDWMVSQKLTVRHQYPVGESMLELDEQRVAEEGLIVPHDATLAVEREQAINMGHITKHANRLRESKPAEPNYLKTTSSLMKRHEARGVKPVYTDEEKQVLASKKVKKQKGPKILLADQREENMKILGRMAVMTDFLRNPRYQDQGKKCPFHVSPGTVIFRE